MLPSCWVVIDWIRSWQGIGGPWAVFGATQWQHPVVLALAAAGGIWLISFVLVAANTGIVIMLTAISLPGRVVGAAAAVLAIASGPAAFALTAGEYAAPAAGRLRLALVQPGLENGPQRRLAAEARLTTGLPRAIGQPNATAQPSATDQPPATGQPDATAQPNATTQPDATAQPNATTQPDATAQSRPDLVVWAESSVGYDLGADRAVLNSLRNLSARIGTQVLVSQDAGSPAGAKSKVAVLVGPAGIEQAYTKSRLVPFGEYIPFRSALGWLTGISRAAPQNMIAGNGARVLHAVLPGGRSLNFGVLICFESSFPDMSRADVDHGAEVLIYQTSDSTFQGSWAPEQHASLAALRAAETGRPAVQAALTGDSAAFDARGRKLAWAGTSYRGVLHVTLRLPRASVRTPFDRLGDYVPWIAIAVVTLAIASAMNAKGLFRRFGRR